MHYSLHYGNKMANINRLVEPIRIWMVQCTCSFRCCNSYLLLLMCGAYLFIQGSAQGWLGGLPQ